MTNTNSKFFAFIIENGFDKRILKDLAQTDLEKFAWNVAYCKRAPAEAFDVKFDIPSEFERLLNRHVTL